VLGGVFELAAYMPEAGRAMPPLALALDVKRRGPAVEAMDRFVEELAATWPVHPTPVDFDAGPGTCLLDLRILPEFAPCYVPTERALVVAWNPESLRTALAAADPATHASPGWLSVRLGLLGEADRRLSRTLSPDAPAPRLEWGWSRLVAYARGDGAGGRALRIELARGDRS
jgi:hypothetical protein